MMSSDEGSTRPLGISRGVGEILERGREVGQWSIVRHLATGGFGTLYEVVHSGSGARGALKLLHAHLLASPEMVARLVREAQVIARLRHPNVVELLEAGVDTSGQPFLVMEYLEGRDLAAVLADRGRVAPAEAITILAPLCEAVAAAHGLGVIHRDIKASNVFVCDEGGTARVVLLDFGIAKLLDVGAVELTASRQALGTPASMAPEQIRGGAVDVRTDVYALGALAFHLLTGRMPFDDASMTMSQYLHQYAARPRPSSHAPLGAEIDEVVAKAMAVEPVRRHPDPLAFLSALRDAVAGSSESDRRIVDGVAIRVGVIRTGDEYDDALLDDVEQVLATADAALCRHGFEFVRDLGDASLFFSTALSCHGAIDAARSVAAELAARPDADARVHIAIWVNAGAADVSGGRLVGGLLDDPAAWGMPEHEGMWIGEGLAAKTTRDDIG
jgi:hypothetical protein